MANDLVRLGLSTDGKDFIEKDLAAVSVVSTVGENAEEHMSNLKKHIDAGTTNAGKILMANADGTTSWTTPQAVTYTKAEIDTKDTTTLNSSKTYTDTKVNALVNGAPGTLDTLKEIADAISTNASTVTAINSAITNKQDKVVVTGLLKGNGTTITPATAGTDYVIPTGNVATATKLATSRTIALSGGVTGTATGFDGSGNIIIPITGIDGTKITGAIPIASIPTIPVAKLSGVIDSANLQKDIAFVSTVAEIATQNLRPGGLVFMKV